MSRYWARGKFGEHERGVRVPRGAAECNSSLLTLAPCAWIVTPFRDIFSIINILARSRSNQLRTVISLHDQLRILSFIPFLFVFKNMIFFWNIYVIEGAFRPSFLNSCLASSFCPCPQRVKPSVRDSSRFLINHTKNNEQIKLNSYGLKWLGNLR